MTFICGYCDDEPLLFVVVLPTGAVWGHASPDMRTGTRNRANDPGFIAQPGDPPIHRRGDVTRPPKEIGKSGAFVLNCRRGKHLNVRFSRHDLDAAAVDAARQRCGRVKVMKGPEFLAFLESAGSVHPAHPLGHLGV